MCLYTVPNNFIGAHAPVPILAEVYAYDDAKVVAKTNQYRDHLVSRRTN